MAMSGAEKDPEKNAQLLKDFADQTPEEIRPDFQVIADAYSKIAGAMKGVDLTSGKPLSAEAIAKLQAISGEIDSAKVTQASKNISTWASKNCTNPK
jgi:hypothetical protein